jgi:hypothetical protein
MTDMVSELDRDTATDKKTKVTVTARPLAGPPWVRFAMAADYPDKGGKQDGEKLKFDVGAGAFDLSFDLDDQSGLSLAFYPDVADAIWVAAGTTCPTQAGNGGGVITGVSVADKKLVVTNANTIKQTLTFALRFTGTTSAGNYPPYVYDPEIVNGGGKQAGDDDGQDEQSE